jgi:putative acetyltransferase
MSAASASAAADHGYTLEIAAWEHPDGMALRAAQRVELDGRYGDDTEPGTKPGADDIGVFVLARDGAGVAVGCGALRRLDGSSAEIKRMYVPPAHRGRGISRLVLGFLEECALAQGWTTLRLETGDRQPEAVGLYAGAGYRRIPNFGAYAGAVHSLCFERRLR